MFKIVVAALILVALLLGVQPAFAYGQTNDYYVSLQPTPTIPCPYMAQMSPYVNVTFNHAFSEKEVGTGLNQYSIQWNLSSEFNGYWLQSVVSVNGTNAVGWAWQIWKGSTLVEAGGFARILTHNFTTGDRIRMSFNDVNVPNSEYLNLVIWYGSVLKYNATHFLDTASPQVQHPIYTSAEVLEFLGDAGGASVTFHHLNASIVEYAIFNHIIHGTLPPFITTFWPSHSPPCLTDKSGEGSNAHTAAFSQPLNWLVKYRIESS